MTPTECPGCFADLTSTHHDPGCSIERDLTMRCGTKKAKKPEQAPPLAIDECEHCHVTRRGVHEPHCPDPRNTPENKEAAKRTMFY